MPTRLIQNSFTAGELSPELHARTDLKAYYQGAQEISNFEVRLTGGVRKRAGTELIWHLSTNGTAAHYRVFPFIHDRTTFCVLALWRVSGGREIHYRLHRRTESGGDTGQSGTVGIATASTDAQLDALRCKQFGDTLIFTARGRRAFRAKVTTATLSVEWEGFADEVSVEKAPTLTATPSGFGTGDSYINTKRKYALYGVRQGIYGPPREVEADISLAWKADAKVTLSFSPDWEHADYYVLGLFLGVHYGVIATFYPSSSGGRAKDTTWYNTNASGTGTINGTTYHAWTGDIAKQWRLDPNRTTESGVHASGAFIRSGAAVGATHKNGGETILAVQLWIGALVKPAGSGTVVQMDNGGPVDVVLRDNAGDTIASWSINALYSDEPQTLLVENPVKKTSANYSLKLTSQSGDPILIRGAVLSTDSGKRTFVDNYVSPGSLFGIQQRLTVGDAGMDVNECDIWEQRLVMASSENLPFTLWFSSVGDLYNFYADRPQVASNAFSVSIPPSGASRILHVKASRWLIVFTESSEYLIDAIGNNAFSYNTISIKKCSSIGAHPDIPPVEAEKNMLFIAQDGRGVYEMRYDLSEDMVVPLDRSLFAKHLTRTSRIVRTAYRRYPEGTLWCLLADHTLLSLAYLPDEQIVAWARHTIGAAAGLSLDDVIAPGSVCDEDGAETTSDVLLVYSHPDAPGDCWVERMRPMPTSDTPVLCKDHMGYAEEDFPPGGNPAESIPARIVTLRPDIPDTSLMALRKGILDCAFRLCRSGKVSARPLHGGLPEMVGRKPQDGELLTGDVKILPRTYQEDDGQMVVESADDHQCEIDALVFNVEIGPLAGRT